MRAVRCNEGQIHVAEVDAPEGDGVRVSVRSAGICGSDLHMLQLGFPMGHTLGHEMAGELSDGTPVAIEPLGPCGHCEFCVTGDYNLCVLGPEMIYGVVRDGGMADEIVVPERCLVTLPAGVSARDACLVEPMAVGVQGLRKAGLRPGQRVAVVGGGGLGLCAVATVPNEIEVALEARHDAQRAAGERLGASLEPEGHYEVVIDAAGSESSLARAVELCRPGGTLVMIATYWQPVQMPGFEMCSKEVTVVTSLMYGRPGIARDVDVAASMLGRRPEIPEAIISHRLPLDAAAEAFEIASNRSAGALKVVVEP